MTGIEGAINETLDSCNKIKVAKLNVRKSIDCYANMHPTKSFLFDHYEGLCKRMVKLKNVLSDLKLKKSVFEAERQRCTKRSENSFCLVFLIVKQIYYL